jgi:cellobiose phosphorylase
MHIAPEMAVERLRFMLSAQCRNGAGLPLVKFNHNAGHEDTPDDESYRISTGHPFYRSDDALWLFPTVDKYVKESGNLAFYDEVIPYAEGGEGTVYEHLHRAIEFNLANMTDLGLPAGLEADWNDCLQTGKKGVSTFVTFQLYYALQIFGGAAELRGDTVGLQWTKDLRESLVKGIEQHLTEPDRYIRAITEDGLRVGSKDSDEAAYWLNPQSWAVISGYAAGDRAKKILDTVKAHLSTDHGAKIFTPPFRKFGMPVARMTLFNPGTKENAGIFSQTQGWIVLAEAKAGNGERAFEYYDKANPASMNGQTDVRQLEPYAHGQFVEGDDSPYFGRGHVHWLTGTASTVMVGAVEGILGVHPSYDGIEFDPCIPADWSGYTLKKDFRGKKLDVQVINETHSQKGVKKVTLNGADLPSAQIPYAKLTDGVNEIKVYM